MARDPHADTATTARRLSAESYQNSFMDRVTFNTDHPWKRDDMAAQSPKVLHLLCTCLLVIAFLAVGIGGWALGNDSGEGGANIGAGILMLFGSAVGVLGLVLGAAALIAYRIVRREERLHT